MTNCEVLGCGCLLVSLASALVTLPRKVLWDSMRAEDTTGYFGGSICSFHLKECGRRTTWEISTRASLSSRFQTKMDLGTRSGDKYMGTKSWSVPSYGMCAKSD